MITQFFRRNVYKDTSYTVLICSMLYGEKIHEQLEEMHTKNTIVVM